MERHSMSVLLVVILLCAAGAYVLTRWRQTPPPAMAFVASERMRESAASPKQAALFAAAAAGDEGKVRALLRDGVDPLFRNEKWVSPLGVAIINDHTAVVRALLGAKVDPNAPALEDQPALFVAVSYLRAWLVPELVRAGAALDYAHPEIGGTLALAIAKGDAKTIEALFRAGVPVGLRNAGGARDIHIAALVGNEEVVKRLIEKGANIHCPNFQGGTPLRSAASTGHAEVVRLLLEAGADPSPVDSFNKRPIDYAKEGEYRAVARILEQAKANPSGGHGCPKENLLASMLPPRDDATLKAVRTAQKEGYKLTGGAAASALEAPSMIAAVRSVMGSSFKVAFPEGAAPDPRLPSRPVELVLWTYEQSGNLTNDALPALSPPPDDVLRLVAGVAEYPYVLPVWSRVSATAARKLRAEDLQRVLAVMVHPPPRPTYLEPWDWYLRVQVAAALVGSQLGGAAWTESPSRNVLEGIVDGPADWTNTAAVIALLDVARRDEAARELVVQALVRTAHRTVNPPAYQHAIRPAALALLEIPNVDVDVVNEMKAFLNEE